MMKKIVISLILIASASLLVVSTDHDAILKPFLNGSKKELFKAYHFIYKKEYELNSEEGIRRYRAFKDNLKFINEENTKGHSYTLGIGPWTDMTNEEYRENVLLSPEKMHNQMDGFFSFDYTPQKSFVEYTPVSINHLDAFGGRTKDQKSCGSCWAFSTVFATEANYKLKTGKELIFSQQQLVDCDTNDKGCNGGWPTYAYNFMRDSGLVLESDYPYKAVKGTCSYQAKTYRVVTGHNQCSMGKCDMDSWLNLLSNGPITVVVDAGAKEFQNYKNGIIDPKNCGQYNHGVIAFGFTPDASGDYIMIKNSWGAGWGEKGNINIRYNVTTKTCHVTSTGWLPLVKDCPGPEPNPSPIPPPNPSPIPPPNPSPIPPPNPSPIPPPKPPVDPKCPLFYPSCDYQGVPLSTCISLKDLRSARFQNKILSAQKSKAFEVNLYSNTECKGIKLKVDQDLPCFNTNETCKPISAAANSVSVVMDPPEPGCINVYASACYTGGAQSICEDIADLEEFDLDNKIYAIHFGSGVKGVIAFLDKEFIGYGIELKDSVANINQEPMKKLHREISSLRLIK